MPKFTKDEVYDLFSTLTATIEFGKKSGAITARKVVYADFPIVALRKIALKGMREFTDAVGGASVPMADKLKAFDKMVTNYQNGVVGRTRGEGESVDPVLDIARDMAKRAYRAKAQDKWDAFIESAKAKADTDKVNVKTLINAELDRVIAASLANGKRDFAADAKAELARRDEMVDGIDLDL